MAASSTRENICAGDYVMVTDGSLRYLKGQRGWVTRLIPKVNRSVEVELASMPCAIGFAPEQLQKVNAPRSGADSRTPDQQTLF